MHYDWSDAWLQQAAGWKAVKEGRALHTCGQVQNACLNGEECTGTLHGSKPRRVKVRRLSASLAETFCSCPENRRSGAMCEHAVAVILQARAATEGGGPAKESPVTPLPRIAESSITVPALAVRFFPRWEQEWSKHRLTVGIEASITREAEESDEALALWAQRQGLSRKPLPWMITLAPGMLEDFLQNLSGHSEILCEKQTIACNAATPRVLVRSQRSGDDWIFHLAEESGQFLGEKNSAWWQKSKRLFQSNDQFLRQFLFTLFSEKCVIIHDSKYFDNLQIQEILDSADSQDPIFSWTSHYVAPQWHMEVEGSLRQLRLRAEKRYQVGEQWWNRPFAAPGSYLHEESNVCYFNRSDDQMPCEQLLRRQGWAWDVERLYWVLSGEEEILEFISEGRGQLQSFCHSFVESPQWIAVRERVLTIEPQVSVREENSEQLSVSLQFSAKGGKALDPAKIRQLLQSGKRLIQTSDGSSLLLPRDSWEVFQRTATDLHLEQKKGEFLAKKSQSLLIDYLRKYINKSLTENDLSDQKMLSFPALTAQLRDYQSWGASWLHERLQSHGFALLADEMGLGKTLQTIALLTLWATKETPALIVVPTSLLYNWEAEIRRFSPSLETVVLHGSGRDALHEQNFNHVIVTSYGVLMNDRARFLKREYSLMVLDEASAIRNPDTEVSRCCFRMKARAKLALTGTPLENSMQDLWSIFQFLQPGYLGERRQFQENYERGVSTGSAAAQSLRLRVMPFLLRRTKEEVVKDLPDKVETDDWCDLSPEQAELYQSVWEAGLKNIEKLAAAHDSAAHMTLLTLLLRLRQICCDAALVAPELTQTWTLAQRSRKMERLFELIQGTRDSGRKMLVFSQFAKQLHVIEAECQQRGYETLRLDGATRDRQALVDRFQRDDGPGVFLISLKAGGYGLNLTNASTVVHFDPWWNPAAEQQASDRAHRIGQTQTVNIYKLLTRGTVEERVKNLQASKSQMADQLFRGSGSQGGLTGMPTMKEIQELLH